MWIQFLDQINVYSPFRNEKLEGPQGVPNCCHQALICLRGVLKFTFSDFHFLDLIVVEVPNAFGSLFYANDMLDVKFEVFVVLKDVSQGITVDHFDLFFIFVGLQIMFQDILVQDSLFCKSRMGQNGVQRGHLLMGVVVLNGILVHLIYRVLVIFNQLGYIFDN